MLRRVRLWGNISRAGGEVARQKMTQPVSMCDAVVQLSLNGPVI